MAPLMFDPMKQQPQCKIYFHSHLKQYNLRMFIPPLYRFYIHFSDLLFCNWHEIKKAGEPGSSKWPRQRGPTRGLSLIYNIHSSLKYSRQYKCLKIFHPKGWGWREYLLTKWLIMVKKFRKMSKVTASWNIMAQEPLDHVTSKYPRPLKIFKSCLNHFLEKYTLLVSLISLIGCIYFLWLSWKPFLQHNCVYNDHFNGLTYACRTLMQRMTIQSPLSSLLVLVSSSKVSRPLTPHSLLRWRQCPPVSLGDMSPHQMLITMLVINRDLQWSWVNLTLCPGPGEPPSTLELLDCLTGANGWWLMVIRGVCV